GREHGTDRRQGRGRRRLASRPRRGRPPGAGGRSRGEGARVPARPVGANPPPQGPRRHRGPGTRGPGDEARGRELVTPPARRRGRPVWGGGDVRWWAAASRRAGEPPAPGPRGGDGGDLPRVAATVGTGREAVKGRYVHSPVHRTS